MGPATKRAKTDPDAEFALQLQHDLDEEAARELREPPATVSPPAQQAMAGVEQCGGGCSVSPRVRDAPPTPAERRQTEIEREAAAARKT